VLLVPGKLEYYGSTIHAIQKEMQEAALETKVPILESNALGPTRIICNQQGYTLEATAGVDPELVIEGSIAHGMYIPGSDPDSIDDKDVMGVFLAVPSHYIGTIKQKDVREHWYNEWDCVHYEILKLAGLLEKGNPNVLSLLWGSTARMLLTWYGCCAWASNS
jgi:hypothetical protein